MAGTCSFRGNAGGWAGALLEVDLSRGVSRRVPLDRATLGEWLGGRGLAVYLLQAMGQAGRDPLDEDAVLLFLAGPLSGSPVPFSGKACVAAVSPLIGLLAYASVGGRLGPAVRAAGLDGVAIRGRCPVPSVVLIDEAGGARVVPRPDLWGLKTAGAAASLPGAAAVIGPAGENGVRFACIIHEGHAAGRGGLGAVMVGKNLKALAVAPPSRPRLPRPADEAALQRALEASRRALASNAFIRTMLDGYRALGTSVGVEQQGVLGGLPARNFSTGTEPGWETPPGLRAGVTGLGF
ncbi:MAG: hypothetical protein K6T75_03170 [Acetobacteraceae bacterium]|nr:hypothetical protein [Acetobacteraceae bacterium]